MGKECSSVLQHSFVSLPVTLLRTSIPLLTLKLVELLAQTALDVALQLAQGGRLQHLEVDLDLVGVGVAHGGLSRLYDAYHVAQLDAR